MTRQEYLSWCKQRSLEYVDTGDLNQAVTSMLSDLGKHEETKNHAGIGLGMQMMIGCFLQTADEVRKFIDGFN